MKFISAKKIICAELPFKGINITIRFLHIRSYEGEVELKPYRDRKQRKIHHKLVLKI